jgi:hypothetical protein
MHYLVYIRYLCYEPTDVIFRTNKCIKSTVYFITFFISCRYWIIMIFCAAMPKRTKDIYCYTFTYTSCREICDAELFQLVQWRIGGSSPSSLGDAWDSPIIISTRIRLEIITDLFCFVFFAIKINRRHTCTRWHYLYVLPGWLELCKLYWIGVIL